jgi:predicted SAM-dependent methyltransferase
MNLIEYKNKKYPHFQSIGNASQFAIPYAKYFCNGDGFDVGCNRIEWAYPGAQPIDLNLDDEWDALNLPDRQVDYIFSSHCLEHLPSWVDALDYWGTKLKVNGTLFLYLPDYSQEYWRPWNNKKHIHVLDAIIIKDYLEDKKYTNVFYTGTDLNNSFMIVAEKT